MVPRGRSSRIDGPRVCHRGVESHHPAKVPELVLLQVHEGMRQLAHHFQQAKAMHTVQLRTILQKLIQKGLLAPESAAYISSLPPATPALPPSPLAEEAAEEENRDDDELLAGATASSIIHPQPCPDTRRCPPNGTTRTVFLIEGGKEDGAFAQTFYQIVVNG